jgi:hypothetical protein
MTHGERCTEKLGLWPGGLLITQAFASFGKIANVDALMQINADRWISQHIASGCADQIPGPPLIVYALI